jgi:hypothetical protein
MNYHVLLLSALLILSATSKAQSVSIDKKVEEDAPQSSVKPELIRIDPSLSAPITVMHDLTIFPPIDQLVKHAIFLEPRVDETHYKVEIYAVKSQEVDNCNKYFLLGDFELKTLEVHISVLPLVVYAPRDIEIKYKIWKQDPRELDAKSF